MDNKKKLFAIILACGLLAGLLGGAVLVYAASRYFGYTNLYPGFNGSNSQGGIVIQDAKNVIVEQDNRLAEVAAASQRQILGLYQKSADQYVLVGQALILTGDGWLIARLSETLPEEAFLKLIAVNIERDEFAVERSVKDSLTGLSYLKLKNARGLPTVKLGTLSSSSAGQTTVAFGYRSGAQVLFVNELSRHSGIKSSEGSDLKLAMSDGIKGDKLIVKNLADETIGLVLADGKLIPVELISSALPSVLSKNQPLRAYLGIHYLDLSEAIGQGKVVGNELADTGKVKAVAADSPLKDFGLRAGDLLLSVDGAVLDNKHYLNDIILNHQPGDKIYVKLKQATGEVVKDIILGGK